MAKVQYHINPETGRPNQCTASVRSCKYAVDGQIPEHYDSKEDAKKAYEQTMSAEHGEVKSLSKESNHSLIIDGYPNFNPNKAQPSDFDAVSAEVYDRFLNANFNKERAFNRILNVACPKKYNSRTARMEYVGDIKQAFSEFRNKKHTNSSDKKLAEEWEHFNKEADKNINLYTKLENIYQRRGAWNRAYLVPDGHLHKSMDCSTCNKGDTKTKFQWMTDYSAKSEKEIVDAAGYRACTTCYPSAPIGDENTLPSKMMTKEEEARAKEQAERKAELAKKKVDAANKAPTASGQPLTARIGRYKETFKTERSASQWYVAGVADGPPRDEKEAKNLKDVRYKIIYNLALKHDRSINDLKAEMDKKAEAKSKRDYKESEKYLKHLQAINPSTKELFTIEDYKEPVFDTYDVPEELMNKSPREWENANQYIPED